MARFDTYFNPVPTTICGILLIVCGIFTMMGNILVNIGEREKVVGQDDLPTIEGYFFAAVLIICGAVAVVASTTNDSDTMIISLLVCSVLALIASFVQWVLIAKDFNYYESRLMYAGDTMMIAFGVIATVLTIILIVFTSIAISKGS